MESIQRLQLQDWAYTLELSIMEVYNDRIRDLLEPGGREVTDMNAIKHGGEQGGERRVCRTSRWSPVCVMHI